MYKRYNMDQRSEEWIAIKLGKVSPSQCDQLITPTGKPSSSLDKYVYRLVAEIFMQEPDETFQSNWMQRGLDLEDKMLKHFNFVYGYEFEKVGFLDSQKGYGCSPDGINEKTQVGFEGKCPAAHTHIKYLAEGELPKEYKPQLQASLLFSGFDKWVFGSFHPSFPDLRLEIGRDEKYIKTLDECVKECVEKVNESVEKLKKIVGVA